MRGRGLCGVKIHPDIQGVDILDPRMLELYELLQARDLPICFHAGDHRPQFRNSEPPKIARVAQLFPHLRINAAHFGGYTVFDDVGTLFFLRERACRSFIIAMAYRP